MKELSAITTNPQSDMVLEEYHTARQVARHLKFNIRTVQGWIKTGKLKATKIGNDYRILDADVNQFMKDHEIKPKSKKK
jgi:excisionase family DNA binding protein